MARLNFWSRLDYQLRTQYGAGSTQGTQKYLEALDRSLTLTKFSPNSRLEGFVSAPNTEEYRNFQHDFLLESIDKGIAMQGYSSPGFELANPDWGLGLTVGSSVLFVVETGGLGLIMGGEGLMGAGLAFNSARVFGYGMKSVAAGSRLLPSVRVAVVAAGGAGAGSRVSGSSVGGLRRVGTEGNVKLSIVLPSDNFGKNAIKARSAEGYTDVIAHGGGNRFSVSDIPGAKSYSARELANRIMRHPDYNGGPIRLLSCNEGGCSNARAIQELSNKMGVSVLSSNDIIYIYTDGLIHVGPVARPWRNLDFNLYLPGGNR